MPMELIFYSNNNIYESHIKKITPNKTKYLTIDKDWKLIETGGPAGIQMLIYPNLNNILSYGHNKLEIYLFSIIPQYLDENIVVFTKNDNTVGYSYDYMKEGKVYTIVSKNHIIRLDNENIKFVERLYFDEIVEAIQKHDIYFYDDLRTVLFTGNEVLASQEYRSSVTYIVKSKIDNNIFWLQ
jgi:hypothetical protein